MFHDLWHGVMEAAYTGPERIQVWGICSTVQLLKESMVLVILTRWRIYAGIGISTRP